MTRLPVGPQTFCKPWGAAGVATEGAMPRSTTIARKPERGQACARPPAALFSMTTASN